MRFCLLFVTIAWVTALIPSRIKASGSWNDPTSDQFHIQTDEGPERYFRYQTHSGQYRKEKRLEDGTVVGTYGWIDSDGLLRLRDYIADNAGYRILRTKNVYVGQNIPISKAIKAAKTVPSSGGVLSRPNALPVSKTDFVTPLPPTVVYPPKVSVLHNSFPSSTEAPFVQQYTPTTPASTSLPSSTLPPSFSTSPLSPTISTAIPPSSNSATPVYISSTTPASYVPSSTPPTVYITSKGYSTPSTTPGYSRPETFVSQPHSYNQPSIYEHSTIAPPINSNDLEYYASAPQYEHYNPKYVTPHYFHNGPTYPIDRHGNIFQGYNSIGNNYNPQYSKYDGVSVTNDGFRYYIPRAYHEEESTGDKKSGSYGYIDPFGIRRVVYYNAGPDGFKHRKNNRYVGFNATPYDPRPYK